MAKDFSTAINPDRHNRGLSSVVISCCMGNERWYKTGGKCCYMDMLICIECPRNSKVYHDSTKLVLIVSVFYTYFRDREPIYQW